MRVQTVTVHRAGHFHDAVAGQVRDVTVIHHVRTEHERLSRRDRLDDARGRLVGDDQLHGFLLLERHARVGIPALALLLGSLGELAVLVQIFVIIVLEPGHVLYDVAVALRREPAELAQDLRAGGPVLRRTALAGLDVFVV